MNNRRPPRIRGFNVPYHSSAHEMWFYEKVWQKGDIVWYIDSVIMVFVFYLTLAVRVQSFTRLICIRHADQLVPFSLIYGKRHHYHLLVNPTANIHPVRNLVYCVNNLIHIYLKKLWSAICRRFVKKITFNLFGTPILCTRECFWPCNTEKYSAD